MTVEAGAQRELIELRLKALKAALRATYPVAPDHTFNADIASLLAAIDQRDRDAERS